MDKDLLFAGEVAEILRVDRQRIYELVRLGMIPVIRLGARQYRFSEGEIIRWLENGGNQAGGTESEKK